MSAFARQTGSVCVGAEWEPGVAQLLDEHHMAAFSPSPARRVGFAGALGRFLQTQQYTEVCNLYGRFITDLDGFCHQLERALPGPDLLRRIDGPRGVTSLLRARDESSASVPSRYRFYIWHDADVLLREDRGLFGRLADALAGVAAEAEYASDDLLLVQRSVFIGSETLDEYAKDPAGQFRCWAPDGFDEPFWRVVTGIEAPSFVRFSIDRLRVVGTAGPPVAGDASGVRGLGV
jgi:hypothetical protein